MIVHDVKQRSDEWHTLRLGIPTASCFHRIMTAKKRVLSSQAQGYMHSLLAEWLLQAPLDEYVSPWMERGKALESQAVAAYEFERGVDASTVGFVTTDDGMIGASPDRLVGADGLLEMKCPLAQTHVGAMVDHGLDDDHITQVQGQLWVAEREWCDVTSYYPGLPLVVVRAHRNEEFIADLKRTVESFVEVLLRAREKLTQEYGDCRRTPAVTHSVEESRAAFDAFVNGPAGRSVV